MLSSRISKFWDELDQWIKDSIDLVFTVCFSIIILKLLFGADMLVPLVVVISGSMEHQGTNAWTTWIDQKGVEPSVIDYFPFQSGFNVGDMLIVSNPDVDLGEVIIYERDYDHMYFPQRDPIIHRVVGLVHISDNKIEKIDGTLDCLNEQNVIGYIGLIKGCQKGNKNCPYSRFPSGDTYKLMMTKGDNNRGTDQCSSPRIAHMVNDNQILGRGWLRIPYIGYLKILLNMLITPIKLLVDVFI